MRIAVSIITWMILCVSFPQKTYAHHYGKSDIGASVLAGSIGNHTGYRWEYYPAEIIEQLQPLQCFTVAVRGGQVRCPQSRAYIVYRSTKTKESSQRVTPKYGLPVHAQGE